VETRVADVQFAVFAASQGADLFHGFVGALQQLPHFLQKKLSLRRECDTAWLRFIKSRRAHPPDRSLPAQRRLSNSQPRGRFGKVQRFRLCHKISQMRSPSLSSIMRKA